MNRGLEKYDNRLKEIKIETSADTVAEQSPKQNSVDNYEDCALSAKSYGSSSVELKEVAENYEDCAVNEKLKADESGIENLEDYDNEDDFDDCKKEYQGQYVAEVTYQCGPENVYTCESDDIELVDTKLVEEPDVPSPTKEEIEELKQARQDANLAREELADAEKEVLAKSEQSKTEAEDNFSREKNTEATAIEILGERIDGTSKSSDSSYDEIPDESETGELSAEAGMEKIDIGSTDWSDRIDEALSRDDITLPELEQMSDENKELLSRLGEEVDKLDSPAKDKFEQLQSIERKSDEYKQVLSEYNDLHVQKENLTDKIAFFRARQELIKKRISIESVGEHKQEIDDSSHVRLREQYSSETDSARKEQIRALDELLTLQETLDLTDGDPDIKQMGGMYGEIKGSISGYEAHHIPPKSVSDTNENKLPAIYLTKDDHAKTSSFRGRMRSKPRPSAFLDMDTAAESKTYKQRLISQINDGNYADAFRNEVYEIKLKFGDKYDGAIKQAIEANRKYLKSFGNPKVQK